MEAPAPGMARCPTRVSFGDYSAGQKKAHLLGGLNPYRRRHGGDGISINPSVVGTRPSRRFVASTPHAQASLRSAPWYVSPALKRSSRSLASATVHNGTRRSCSS
jgi:hypothetical protein